MRQRRRGDEDGIPSQGSMMMVAALSKFHGTANSPVEFVFELELLVPTVTHPDVSLDPHAPLDSFGKGGSGTHFSLLAWKYIPLMLPST